MKNTTYNLKSIMTRAWAIARETAVKASCKVSEVYFAGCLKMAWAEAEGVNAEANANKIVREWAALGESGQTKMMTACVRKAAKNEIAYSTEDHYLQFSEVPAWYMRGHDFDEFISETWLKVRDKLGNAENLAAANEKRAAQGKRPLTLVSIVYNAARASIAAIYYQDRKHDRARLVTVVGDDGEEYSYFDTMEAASNANTERSAMIRVEMERYVSSRDSIDQKIMEMLPQGFTERQIAAVVGISNVAVHKRIVRMRNDLGYLRAA